jgi:hypothetical protein
LGQFFFGLFYKYNLEDKLDSPNEFLHIWIILYILLLTEEKPPIYSETNSNHSMGGSPVPSSLNVWKCADIGGQFWRRQG